MVENSERLFDANKMTGMDPKLAKLSHVQLIKESNWF